MRLILWILMLLFSLIFTILIFTNESLVLSLFKQRKVSLPRPSYLNHDLMKSKMIWLMCDAYSNYLTGDLSKYSNHSSFFHIRNYGYPQSAAISSSQLLGRQSRNYVGELLQEETILDKLKNPFKIVGSNFPVIDILGEKRFSSVKRYKGREKYPFSRINHNYAFPTLSAGLKAQNLKEAQQIVTSESKNIKSLIDPIWVIELLKKWTNQKSQNFIYYTTIMDSYNHNYAGLHETTISGASLLLADIKSIIDAFEISSFKDDYLLIISSDHGGQLYFGEDEICNHGCQMDKGNEGFLFIYSYGSEWQEDWITNEDVAAIIASYMRDATIPLAATGWPKSITRSEELIENSLKIKEFQLSQVLDIEMKNQTLPNDEFFKYLKEIEAKVLKIESSNEVLMVLAVLAGVLIWKMWENLGLETGFWVFEHLWVMLFANDGRRIEDLLFHPLVCVNCVMAVQQLIVMPWSKFRSNSWSLGILRYKVEDLVKSYPSLVISSVSIWFLLTQETQFDPVQDYRLYYIHYLIFYFDLGLIFSILYYQLRIWFYFASGLLLLIMIFYEWITDYSMTDQTLEMIISVRVFYILLFLLVAIILSIPEKCKILTAPFSILYFFIASQDQRTFFVIFFLPANLILVKMNKAKDLLILAVSGYLIMFGTFGFDISLRAGNHSWGVNPDDFPIFTGFLFGVHKFAWLMIGGCSIMACEDFKKYSVPMVIRGLLAIVIFFIIFIKEPSSALSAFMWCMGQNLNMIISHSLGILPLLNPKIPCKRKHNIQQLA